MPNIFQNKYRIPSNRLPGYDYGADGWYFVTICTKNRVHYFGDIVHTHNRECDIVETRHCASLQYTETGTVAHDFWLQIPQHYPFVQLDAFVIMPDHIHAISPIKPIENPMCSDRNRKTWGPLYGRLNHRLNDTPTKTTFHLPGKAASTIESFETKRNSILLDVTLSAIRPNGLPQNKKVKPAHCAYNICKMR